MITHNAILPAFGTAMSCLAPKRLFPVKMLLVASKLLVRPDKRNDFSTTAVAECDMQWGEAVQKYFKKNEKNACQRANRL
jgi:hypothetical protein